MSGSEDSESECEEKPVFEKEKGDMKLKQEPAELLANPFSVSGGGGRTLPKPSFMQEAEKIAGVKFDSSVFSNPFRYGWTMDTY